MKYITKEQDEIIGKLAEDADVRGALINLMAETSEEAVKNYKIDTKKLARKSKKKGFVLGAFCAAASIYLRNHWDNIKAKFKKEDEELCDNYFEEE